MEQPTTTPHPALRALVVDDLPEQRMLLEPLLRREGFDVMVAADGVSCVELARSFEPDVILLDLVMPAMDGIEACRRIRTFSDAYVLMLTAKDAELDRVIGLTVGADDYVVKPYSPSEVVARVRAMLRRPRTGASAGAGAGRDGAHTNGSRSSGAGTSMPERHVRVFGDLRIDVDSREVTMNDEPLDLTRIEFDLLATLTSRPRRVFERRELLELVWGPNWYGDTHVVDVHISNLRGKLGDRGRQVRMIETVRGVGFRLGTALTNAAA